MKPRFRPERLLPLACLAGGGLLFASQFMSIFELNSAGPTAQALISSSDQHWLAMGVLGLYAVVATIGAVWAGSKPLAVSVAVAGVVALRLFLLIDLPDAGKTGTISSETVSFLTAKADPGDGFWIELLGSLVLTICGAALATLSPEQLTDLRPRRRRGAKRPRRPRRTESTRDGSSPKSRSKGRFRPRLAGSQGGRRTERG